MTEPISRTKPPDQAAIRGTADELRAGSLPIVVAMTIVLALLWFVLVADPAHAATWLPPLVVLLAAFGSFFLARAAAWLGATLLVASQVVGVVAFAVRDPGSFSASLFVIPVISAGVLLGPRSGVALGAITTLLAGALAFGPARLTDANDALNAIILIWIGAILVYAASHPVYAAVTWAWASYHDALKRADEVREHRGELAKALASLNETVYRLEVANLELARARAAADEARQLKTEFAANISHELRTPLNLVIGFSEILLGGPVAGNGAATPPAFRADVEVIHRNARHLSALIDDVLDLSQVDAGRMGLHKERADLATIAEEAAGAVARLYQARGLTVKSAVPADLPPVYVDRTRIRQVLINLLNNAARFTPKGGTTICARAEDGNVVVDVSDTGVGIAAADIPKVFEEFRQLDGTTRRPHDGSGLGLAICQRFVELHGGTIWCVSELGQGARFSFTLPVIANVAGAALRPEWDTWVRVAEPEEPPARPIVLVNRDPRIERMFQRYLDGYRIVPAVDEDEALRRCAETGARGIILVESPEVDAAERRRRLRQVPRDAPIILCSLPTSVTLGQRLGVSDYLIKPISRERLLETLARAAPKARTVLVVDDDPDMVRLIARLLRSGSRRYRVLRAYGGAEALDLLRENRPDAMILDLVMPGIDGYEIIRQVRATDGIADLPIVAVSARSYETETVVAGGVEISREGGLSVGDLMACLQSSLDAMTEPRESARPMIPDDNGGGDPRDAMTEPHEIGGGDLHDAITEPRESARPTAAGSDPGQA